MKSLSYKRIYKSQEYLATLGTIEYRSLFGSYSLTVVTRYLQWFLMASCIFGLVNKVHNTV